MSYAESRHPSRDAFVQWAGLAVRRAAFGADILIGGMAAVGVLGLGLLVLPRGAFPLHDEAFYVEPVVRLARTGKLVLPAVNSASFVGLAAWGAAFVKVFGGDFVTLRLAALVAGVLAAVVFYALLRQLGFDRTRSCLALGVLVLNPLYVYSATLFMTESLFILLVLGSLYAGMLGLQQGRGWLLLLAGLLTGAAFLTRQIGLLVVIALAAGLLAHRRLRCAPGPWLMLLVPPALVVAGYLLWRLSQQGVGDAAFATKTIALWTHEGNPIPEALRRLDWAVSLLGLFLLPLLLVHAPALLSHLARLDRRGKAVLAGSLLLVAGQYIYERRIDGIRHFPYMGEVLDPRGLSMMALAPTVYQDYWPHEPWLVAGTLVMWGAAGVVLGLSIRALHLSPRAWWRHPQLPLYLTGALFALSAISVYQPGDRYMLPVVPFALIGVLVVTWAVRPSLPLAAVVLTSLVALNMMLMVDFTQRGTLKWEVSRQLVGSGIPMDDIYAGFEWRDWWRYWQMYPVGEPPPGELGATSEMYPIGSWPAGDAWSTPYLVLAAPKPGYEIEQTYSYWSPLGWKERHIYVLHRVAVP